ncbi:hypothetical protein NDU88_003943 [Pleurodeles waltl]|uniref:Cadherin domain-containing protein n=1 Tax=Pleurodeles waltl TaxID=8319 RepID=A0AAV7WU87_PLEWA|nr:hypothetical protein NDU88_003943 [Pleurodeles waltl]
MRAPSSRLLVLLCCWLWATSCSRGQVFNLSLTVDEELPADTLVGDLRAGLPDPAAGGGGFFLSVEAAGGGEERDSPVLSDFQVDPESGIIRTARPLDRERREYYSFCAATLQGVLLQVDIRVRDINDHAPSWGGPGGREQGQPRQVHSARLGNGDRHPGEQGRGERDREGPPETGEKREPGVGNFGNIQGNREEHGSWVPKPNIGVFEVRGSGQVRDPGQGRDPKELEVFREDIHLEQVTDPREGGYPVQVSVVPGDVKGRGHNDGSRGNVRGSGEAWDGGVEEGTTLRLEVSELTPPGTSFLLPGARDPDAGPLGLQGYSLLLDSDGAFRLHYGGSPKGEAGALPLPGPLELVLTRPLDREKEDRLQLLIEAFDGGWPRQSGWLWVEVVVLDANDNPPTFSESEYEAFMPEDALPGSTVCSVHASDPDQGSNGMVQYHLLDPAGQSPGGPFFLVEPRSGVVRVTRPLDRESRAVHQLLVLAQDGGSEPEQSSSRLTIRVLDINDNSPHLSVSFLLPGGPAISEGTLFGEYIARVSASDPDTEDGAEEEAQRVWVSLQGGEGAFSLLPAGVPGMGLYFLCVAGVLDREAQEQHHLRLLAWDSGQPPLWTEEDLLLRVTDINDQAPTFLLPHYQLSVPEAAVPGTVLLILSAQDLDAEGPNSQVRYRLLKGATRESEEEGYTGALSAGDSGNPSVGRLGLPDTGPSPIPNTRGSGVPIKEDSILSGQEDSDITRSRDSKVLNSGDVVVPTVGNQPVPSIGNSGEIKMRALEVPITEDNEGFVAGNSDGFGHRDPGVSSIGSPGVSRMGNSQVQTTRASAVLKMGGSGLPTLGASEAPTMDRSEVTDSTGWHSENPSAEDWSWFHLDPDTGELSLARALDREQKEKLEFWVEAMDMGRPALSSICNITIQVEDANDNAPIFEQPLYNVSLTEHAPLGHCFLKVSTTPLLQSVHVLSPR